jgi:phosphate starvation-inducible protein PhoH
MSGLNDAAERFETIKGFGTIRFTAADVVRHPIVGRIVEAYEGNGEEGQGALGAGGSATGKRRVGLMVWNHTITS